MIKQRIVSERNHSFYQVFGSHTFGASRDKILNMLYSPVLATQSQGQGELTVTTLAKNNAKSRIGDDAFGRPIASRR